MGHGLILRAKCLHAFPQVHQPRLGIHERSAIIIIGVVYLAVSIRGNLGRRNLGKSYSNTAKPGHSNFVLQQRIPSSRSALDRIKVDKTAVLVR